MNTDWPFTDPENLAVITLNRILAGSRPVLYVLHDQDGYWQFLDGENVTEEDAAVVSLREIVNLDPRLHEIADLPRGWDAWRRSTHSEWMRSQA
jgi:hypothetical protein